MKSHLPYLSDAHALAIAHVAIRSAWLDHLLEILLVELFHPNVGTAKRLVKEQAQSRQIDHIESMLIDRFPWITPNIKSFMSDIKFARSERNDVIHHLWGQTDESGAASLGSYRPFREPKERSMTAAEVGAVADLLLRCSHDALSVTRWLEGTRPPSPNTLAHMLQHGSSLWPLDDDQRELPLEHAHQPPPDETSDPQQ